MVETDAKAWKAVTGNSLAERLPTFVLFRYSSFFSISILIDNKEGLEIQVSQRPHIWLLRRVSLSYVPIVP